MKIKFLVLFLTITTYGQQSLSPDLISFPVSPEAARMVSYGNTPVNLFYGQLDQTVELFSGKIGDFEIPVNLMYNYSGFRLEEVPSIVGLGWQMSTGGVISREVRGLPDEHPRGYYGGQQFIIGPYFNTGNMTYQQATELLSGHYDSEADIYHLSVNGINLSFKIGLDGKPAFLTQHDYKLEINANQNDIVSFTLTDTNGNIYYFNLREYTKRLIGSDSIFDDNFQKYVTSWQLSKITTNRGSQIIYNYQDDLIDNYSYYASGSVLKKTAGPGNVPQNIYELPEAKYTYSSAKDQVERKLLTSIVSENFTINFTTSTSNSQDVYSAVVIKDQNGKIINNYAFTYSGVRNTLAKITRNGKFYYEFSYYGGISTGFANSTIQFPWNQDYWGYVNGANNSYALNIPNSAYTANRNPSYGTTASGALRSIKYPTGGYNEIYYELNTIAEDALKTDNVKLNSKINIDFQTDYPSAQSTYKEWTFTKTFDTDVVATLSHSISVTPQSDMEVSIETVGGCNSDFINYYQNIPHLRSQTGVALPKTCIKLSELFNDDCNQSTCTYSQNSGGRFILAAGTYKFNFYTTRNNYFGTCNFVLDYYRPDIVTTPKVNKEVGGLRVSKIIDYPINGTPITRMYDYNDENGLSTAKEYSQLVNVVKYKHLLLDEKRYADTNYPPFDPTVIITIPKYDNFEEYSSRPFNAMLKRGIPVYYTSVKEYVNKEVVFTPIKLACDGCSSSGSQGSFTYQYMGDPNIGGGKYGSIKQRYTNGFKQTIFDPTHLLQSSYPFKPAGNDNTIGRVIQKSIYKGGDEQFIHEELTREKTSYLNFSFNDVNMVSNNTNYPKSLKIGYLLRGDNYTNTQNYLQNNYAVSSIYNLVTYKESDFSTGVATTKTSEYFDGSAIENTKIIGYDSHRQLKNIRRENSDDEDIISTTLYYPYDFPSDAVSLSMVSKNVLASPLKVVQDRNTEVIETTQYNYSNIIANLFKPKSFLKSKANNSTEERMNYNYDTKGNIILVYDEKLQSGIPQDLNMNRTVVIWGYNKSVPIAKIENIDLATIPSSVLIDLETKSNADTDNFVTCFTSTCKEIQLRDALDQLRITYPTALITTYTYDPLIGITSITNPQGRRITYEYDGDGRVIRVKDHEGNIINENSYRFTTQN